MRRLDLNLLLVFEALMTERSVSRAAVRLNRSQPAVSQALARLRTWFGDPLFVRASGGLRATGRAEQLWESCGSHLQELRDTLSPATFEPARSRLRLTFGAAEDTEIILLPGIIDRLARQLADSSFDVQPTDWQSAERGLAKGAFDLAFTIAPNVAPELQGHVLLRAGFACLYDPRVVTPPKRVLRWYMESTHVAIQSSEGRATFVDEFFKSKGVLRRRRVRTRNILAAADYVTGSSAIATVPAPLAERFVKRNGLAAIALPIRAAFIDYSMLWMRARVKDPAFRWAVEEIIAAAKPG
jgi:DNA-binding transcriptional LysR family regulator